ncbi:MAG: calcium-binding protein [Candidatus Thiodiazotropha lotti]|nr:calcium-binding protein [Candidatus Thiodiazotropha lotti]ODC00631.1 hypothetical protein A3197_09950 [Candidatus Thiodiazotropha endoloripes]MCW4208764.1 calcium-binding protein [Candidatus Thiodiazotropha lotti]MCW4213908.1 calcium-binding protein [Candidatus Thiodiazotropha lotti]MCW4214317.1 calcium-binding protein [Candidatus Thiodiazotropha lotti]
MDSIQGSPNSFSNLSGGFNPNNCTRVDYLDNGGRIERNGDTTRVFAGSEDNHINIHTNSDGSVDLTIDGETHHLTAQEAKNLIIDGGCGNDNISVTGQQLCGPENNITINGGSGDDVIRGGAGNETINGGSGNDWISGGSGNDKLHGGLGNDTLIGGDGHDRLNGGDGDDGIWGGAGNDFVSGDNGNDTLVGNSGNDRLVGGHGNDNLWGGSGNDLMQGGEGNDKLIGGSGDDRIYGGRGDDHLWGNSGDDILVGERGNDCIDGGSGNNTRIDAEDDFIVIDDGPGPIYGSQENSSGGSFNPFDPMALFTGGGASLGTNCFPLNLISPR